MSLRLPTAVAQYLMVMACLLFGPRIGVAQQTDDHAHHAMRVEASGTVMGANSERLPRDCPAVSGDQEFTVHAGRKHAQALPGLTYAYDQRELRVAPCSRVTVHFHNDDEVRHQWMVHGLPRYLYPGGMFHIEASGGAKLSASFIVPSDDATYLVHCDIAQHTEKGMKGQLVVGRGSGDLWAVPGVTAALRRDNYLPMPAGWLLGVGLVAGLVVARLLR